MFIIIDNYDSFTYNLVSYLQELGETTKVYRNDTITVDFIQSQNPTGILISPGPKTPEDTGICIEIIKTLGPQIPILGVCLGHQTIAYALGGHVVKGPRPMHGKVTPIVHYKQGVFKGLSSPMNVTRYHSLIVKEDKLPNTLEITALSQDGIIMGIKHKHYPIEGIQFHPEAVLSEHGHDILRNFIEFANNY